jgi:putative phage-type endonuclease
MTTKLQELLDRQIKTPQKSKEWYEERYNIIGSSEVAAALDCNLYQSSLELLKLKCMPLNHDNNLESEASIQWGNKFEPIARKYFEHLQKTEVTECSLIKHQIHQWLGASPDGILPNGYLLEIKCPIHRVIYEDRIPYYYWIQTQAQMEVCNVDFCYFFQCKFATSYSPFVNAEYSGQLENGEYWMVTKYTLDLIKRDKEWWTKQVPVLFDFWRKVEHYRIHGINKLNADIGKELVYYSTKEDPSTNVSTDLQKNAHLITPLQLPESLPQSKKRKLDAVASPIFTSTTPIEPPIDWNEWVAASSTRNYMLKDQLTDWLKLYDTKRQKTNNNSVNKFTTYLQQCGIEFENKIMQDLYEKFPNDIITIATPLQGRMKEKVNATIDAMKAGTPIIAQAVLHNDLNQTYGVCDLLIRSDWFKSVFEEPPLYGPETKIGCDFNRKYHYRVVEIKCSTLQFRADGTHLLNCNSVPAYKAQLCIYNAALGLYQGYEPPEAYIIGKAITYTSRGAKTLNTNPFYTAGTIDYNNIDHEFIEETTKAVNWIRKLRREGHTWATNPPSNLELYPNMCVVSECQKRKAEIAEELGEITQVYYCGVKNREAAYKKQVTSWKDPRCTTEVLNINGPKIKPIVDAILSTNRSTDLYNPPYLPHNFIPKHYIEFYIDFETVNDLQNTSVEYLFMVGIGYRVNSKLEWNYTNLTTDFIDPTSNLELNLLQSMLHFITNLLTQHSTDDFHILHWSHAEPTIFKKLLLKYNLVETSIIKPHNWCDLLKLFTSQLITVKGALDYSLKSIAKALYKHKLIAVTWPESSISNGLDAMVQAIECSKLAQSLKVPMCKLPIMKDIIKYNEIDCKVLFSIVSFLRKLELDE